MTLEIVWVNIAFQLLLPEHLACFDKTGALSYCLRHVFIRCSLLRQNLKNPACQVFGYTHNTIQICYDEISGTYCGIERFVMKLDWYVNLSDHQQFSIGGH